MPVRPVKGQILRLAGEPLLEGTVRALVRGRSVYLVPYGADRVVVGASVEEQGFDARVTAGAVLDLLRDATEVVPGLTELELVETLARWRPGTPDNGPLLGPSGAARAGPRDRPLPQRGAAGTPHRPGGRRRAGRRPPRRARRGVRRRPLRPHSPGDRMNVTVNGNPAQLADGLSVAALVEQRAPDHRRIAVAVNADVVPRSAWQATVLRDGDAVEVLVAVAGG